METNRDSFHRLLRSTFSQTLVHDRSITLYRPLPPRVFDLSSPLFYFFIVILSKRKRSSSPRFSAQIFRVKFRKLNLTKGSLDYSRRSKLTGKLLANRTNRTISSDQRIADPRNVATLNVSKQQEAPVSFPFVEERKELGKSGPRIWSKILSSSTSASSTF